MSHSMTFKALFIHVEFKMDDVGTRVRSPPARAQPRLSIVAAASEPPMLLRPWSGTARAASPES